MSGAVAVRGQIVTVVVERCAEQMQGVTVEDNPSGDPESFPNVAVFDRGHRVLEHGLDQNLYALSLQIEGAVQGDGGRDTRQRLDALYRRTIMALLADERFGGLADEFKEGDLTIDTVSLASTRTTNFVLSVEIQFFARRTDPALQ